MDLHHLSSRLGVGIRPRLRRVWKALDRVFFLRFWFPHVPLFLAVAIFGILELSPVAGRLIGLNPADLLDTFRGLLHTGIRYTPQAAAGLLLVIERPRSGTTKRQVWNGANRAGIAGGFQLLRVRSHHVDTGIRPIRARRPVEFQVDPGEIHFSICRNT